MIHVWLSVGALLGILMPTVHKRWFATHCVSRELVNEETKSVKGLTGSRNDFGSCR